MSERRRVRFQADRGRSERLHEKRRSDRDRSVLPGYPKTEPFATKAEVLEYVDHPTIECLLCGRRFRAIGAHLTRIHSMSTSEYKDRYLIPYSIGLAGTNAVAKMRLANDGTRMAAVRARLNGAQGQAVSAYARARHNSNETTERLLALSKKCVNPSAPGHRAPCHICGVKLTPHGRSCWGCRYPKPRLTCANGHNLNGEKKCRECQRKYWRDYARRRYARQRNAK